MRIGILRESDKYCDPRVVLPPEKMVEIRNIYPEIEFVVQPSPYRIFSDQEYSAVNVPIYENLSNCDILLGIKDVDTNNLIVGKTYFYFAHIAKGQSIQSLYLKELMEKKITLVDYEYLTDDDDKRITAFGYWAGKAGVVYAILALFQRFAEIDPINTSKGFDELVQMASNADSLKLPAIKIVLTGTGNSATGAIEMLRSFQIVEVDKNQFLHETFGHAVFCQLGSEDYVKTKDGTEFSKEDFYAHPEKYEAAFLPYTKAAEIFIPCHYWKPGAPEFFSTDNMKAPDFKIRVVSDVSCDVGGPIPCTLRESTNLDPYYDYDPVTETEQPAFSNTKNITVISIGNLPSSFAKDASYDFANSFIQYLLPEIVKKEESSIIEKATILKNGQLTPAFSYLYNTING